MSQNGVYGIGATVVTLGVLGSSVFPTKISPPAGAQGGKMKLLGAAGSTVQILPNSLPGFNIGGATGAALGASISGYPITTLDFYRFDGPAVFYLAATGATATVAFTFDYSASGCTLA